MINARTVGNGSASAPKSRLFAQGAAKSLTNNFINKKGFPEGKPFIFYTRSSSETIKIVDIVNKNVTMWLERGVTNALRSLWKRKRKISTV